jgi:transcriptional regulator with XRE-family HTH domain
MTEKDEARIRREFSERLNEALDDMGVPTKDLGRQTTAARLFGVSQKGVRKWLEGEGLPHTKRISKIANKVNVRQEWLLFGLGPKQIDPEEAGRFNTNLMQRIMVSK